MIIGFKGYKRSGKTTAANYLCSEHKFKMANFKDGLIAEMIDNLPDTLNALCLEYSLQINQLFEKKPHIMRTLMQNYGTDLRRKENPNYWVEIWQKTVANLDGHVVVDDVRFTNEADAIRLAGGIIVHIHNTDIEPTDAHVSENEAKEIEPDFTITCANGDIECINKNIESMLEDLKAD